MTVSPSEESTKPGFGTYLRACASGGALGAGIACCVVAFVLEKWFLLAVGGGLITANVVLVVAWATYASRRERGERAERGASTAPEPVLALARIESRRAVSSESADIPVEFVLTVAPDDARAYRVKLTQSVNLVDIPDYKPRTTVVVRTRPDRPWDVTIVAEPDDDWVRRAAAEAVDSAPESTLVEAPGEDVEGGVCLVVIVGLLLGAALVVLANRGDLFDDDTAPGRPPSSTSTTTTDVAVSEESMLAPGEMRRAAEELMALAGTGQAVRFSIDESSVTLEAPQPADPRLVDGFEFRDDEAQTEGPSGTRSTGGGTPLIDLRAIPYERLPELVAEAKASLGLTAPTGWHIAFDHDPRSGELVIRVSVLDDYGSASLTADAHGTVTHRSPR
ncbi:hypothetical protein LO772_17320 [Yinghuangia sp. ASG 101]|uniref:hypothetical protein n=1 Tax=Yinghuangia sp. ASG 101 TaxID=2896848 RepID=UPI001E4CDD76|nr:hypothetical protein [Yinghuangia sp. ASG 101]UGQ15171.1 hypothetical protein LO772_17320 [Yinghuangia sp. ASG 101]